MRRFPSLLFTIVLARAVDPCAAADGETPRSVEEVAKASRGAVVVISSSGRTGEIRGAGSGFVAAPGGFIVTNFHVIGEGRAFTVQLDGGTKLKPASIVAFDRTKDIAVISVDVKDLPSLALGDSDALKPGQALLAIGNSLGLGISVTSGTLAQTANLEAGRPLLQVAMPVEPGSSGSPLIGLDGKVAGVIVMKPAESTALAIPINDVKALLASPRPVTMERWLKIGALDPKLWRPVLGGEWRQRAGRIIATGPGEGFGGRTLCLSESPLPEGDMDLAVEVRLEDESGAAGLAFHSDGGDRHYGFYPTGGSLRLTRFEGPTVFTWSILETVSSEHYRPGEWNEIRVRLRGSKITCLVNGEVVIEKEDSVLSGGKAGLVKFREPGAELRRFRVAPELDPLTKPAGDAVAKAFELSSRLARGEAVEKEALDAVLALGEGGAQAVAARAATLEKEAKLLRSLAERARLRSIGLQIAELLKAGEDDIDLLRAALLVAKLDNAGLDVEPFIELADRMGREARERLEGKADGEEKLRAFLDYLFVELGFRGSDAEYYHRSNSHLNEVLEDREGIPITLSVVAMEIGRRSGVLLAGVGIPSHFLLELRPRQGEPMLIDAFGGGKIIDRKQAEELAGMPLDEEHFAVTQKRQIILRILRNLLGAAQRERDVEGMLRYLDVIVSIDDGPDAEGQDRWARAMLKFQIGHEGVIEDLEWLEGKDIRGVDPADVTELLEMARRKR